MTRPKELNSPWHQYIVRIRQCTLPFCTRWYVGAFHEYYCPDHRSARARNLKGRGGKKSRFSMEEILEIRDLYLQVSPHEIAEQFGCSVKTVYRLQHETPKNLRPVNVGD